MSDPLAVAGAVEGRACRRRRRRAAVPLTVPSSVGPGLAAVGATPRSRGSRSPPRCCTALERQRRRGLAGEVERPASSCCRGRRRCRRSTAWRPRTARRSWRCTPSCGSTTTTACALSRVVLLRAELQRLLLARHDGLVVEPAELELVPRAEVAAAVADAGVVLGAEPALGHQGPVLVVVVAAARCRSRPAGRGRGRTRGRRRCGRRSPAGSCSHRSRCRCCRSGCRRAGCSAGRCGRGRLRTRTSGGSRWRPHPGCGSPSAWSPPEWTIWKWSM